MTPSFELFERQLHPDDAARVAVELQRALDGQSRYDCRHRVLRADWSSARSRWLVDVEVQAPAGSPAPQQSLAHYQAIRFLHALPHSLRFALTRKMLRPNP